MGSLVDLAAWRTQRGAEPAVHPAAAQDDVPRPADVARLERAVNRLSPLVTRALDERGRLEAAVETDLLAIMGALATGMCTDAAERAERLAERLAGARRAGGG